MKRFLSVLFAFILISFYLPGIGVANQNVSRPDFDELNDPSLLSYVKDTFYEKLVDTLNSHEYFVENVQTVYYPQAFLDAMAFQARRNIYFGYTLEELDQQFQGKRYYFTLGDDGTTVVKAFEAYQDPYEKLITDVAVGTGVILICATVSLVTGGMGAPAVSMIFAVGAKTGTVCALSGGILGGLSAYMIDYIQTGNSEEALKAGLDSAGDGFKWGAITGTLLGGAGEAILLKGAALNGLTMNEAALIQQQTKLPLEFISNFHSMEEYNIYVSANLKPQTIGNHLSFTRSIDMNSLILDQNNRCMTNIQRIQLGLSPVDPSGIPYELHHIGQQPDSPLAILTFTEHMQNGNFRILHYREDSLVEHGAEWIKQVKEFWQSYLAESIELD